MDAQQYRCDCETWARNVYPAGALVPYAAGGPRARKLERIYQALTAGARVRVSGLVVDV